MFFFNYTATTEIYTLSQHDALPISNFNVGAMSEMPLPTTSLDEQREIVRRIETAFAWIDRLASEATSARKLIDRLDQAILSKDRKSTRLNSSHANISYAVFCLKKQ